MVTMDSQQFVNIPMLMHNTKKKKMLLSLTIIFIAFCFSQAIFFENVVPLFLPFWLTLRYKFPAFQKYAFVGGLAGTFLLGFGQGLLVLLQIALMESIVRFKYINVSPYVLLTGTILLVQTLWQFILYGEIPPVLVIFAVVYEFLFALMLLFFLDLLTKLPLDARTYEWTQEKIVAIIVVLASVIVGMQSFTLFYFSLPLIALHLLICMVALTSTIGATVIFSLALGFLIGLGNLSFTGMMILYACTGLIASFVQKLDRMAVALFSVLPSLFFFFYDATLPLDSVYFISMLTGTLLFLLLPKNILHFCRHYFLQHTKLTVQIHRNEMVELHLQHFQQFVVFMKELVFERFTKDTAATVHEIVKKEPFIICSSCFRYEHCWGQQKEMTAAIENWRNARRSSKPVTWIRAEERLKSKCIKSSKLLEELQAALQKEQMERQFYHGKKMIALQLQDLTHHLELLLQHQQREFGAIETTEKLMHYLNERTFQCLHIEWIKNEMGEREFICYIADQREAYFVIHELEQLLFEWLHEPVQGELISEQQHPIFYRQLRFCSAIRYQLEYDIYTYSHKEHAISGDSYRVFAIHPGLMAIMLSDGMGTSYRAQQESERLIQMMQDCLTYNMDPETAMHTMHYVLSLKNDSDMYATMDFALVDLQFGNLWCWKAGGMTTYVLRGSELFKVESTSAPIGMLPDFAVDTEMVQLLAEDVILMVSDGLFTAFEQWEVQEQRFIASIRQSLEQGASIQVALFDCMTQYKQAYAITDDCTVMLFRMQHVAKPWHVFRAGKDVSLK